jgi:hypothetical protein
MKRLIVEKIRRQKTLSFGSIKKRDNRLSSFIGKYESGRKEERQETAISPKPWSSSSTKTVN